LEVEFLDSFWLQVFHGSTILEKLTLNPNVVTFRADVFTLYQRSIPSLPVQVIFPAVAASAFQSVSISATLFNSFLVVEIVGSHNYVIMTSLNIVLRTADGSHSFLNSSSRIQSLLFQQYWKRSNLKVGIVLDPFISINPLTIEMICLVPALATTTISSRASVILSNETLYTPVLAKPLVWFAPFAAYRTIRSNEELTLYAYGTERSVLKYNRSLYYRWNVLSDRNASFVVLNQTPIELQSGVLRLAAGYLVPRTRYTVFVSLVDAGTETIVANSSKMSMFCNFSVLKVNSNKSNIYLSLNESASFSVHVVDPSLLSAHILSQSLALFVSCLIEVSLLERLNCSEFGLSTRTEPIGPNRWNVSLFTSSDIAGRFGSDVRRGSISIEACDMSYSQRDCTEHTVSVLIFRSQSQSFARMDQQLKYSVLASQPLQLDGSISIGWSSVESVVNASWNLVAPKVSLLNSTHPAFASMNSLQASLENQRTTISQSAAGATRREVHVPLFLPMGVLVSGGHYTFRLTCSVCGAAHAEVEVTINRPPNGGRVVADPLFGKALDTRFTIFAPDWMSDVDEEDCALEFRFEIEVFDMQLSRNRWIPIPGYKYLSFVDSMYFPSGIVGRHCSHLANDTCNNTLMFRCSVTDLLEATTVQKHATGLSIALSQIYLSTIGNDSLLTYHPSAAWYSNSLVQRVFYDSPLSIAQSMLALYCEWQYLLNIETIAIADMLRSVQIITSLLNSRSRYLVDATDNSSIASPLLSDLNALLNVFSVLETQRQSSLQIESLAGSMGADQVSLSDVSKGIVSVATQLQELLLSQLINKGVPSVQTASVVTGSIRMTVALIPQSAKNSSESQIRTDIAIANSTNTVAVGSLAGSNAFVSVVEYDSSFWMKSSAQSNTSTSEYLQLASDVVSIRLTYLNSNDSGRYQPVSFVANLTVNSPVLVTMPTFSYNCTKGKSESQSFLCPQSLLLMKLTCSGKASAAIIRKCPAPYQVCNVLSLTTGAVASTGYCKASQSSGSTVTCVCGAVGNSSSLDVGAFGGAVNVAVMTQYVTSGFSGAISSVDTSFAVVAQQSMAVFITFGSIWSVGFLLIGVYLFWNGDRPSDRKATNNKEVTMNILTNFGVLRDRVLPDQPLHLDMGASPSMIEKRNPMELFLNKYLWSLLPSVFYPLSWHKRIWLQFAQHHKYISAMFQLLDMANSTNESQEKKKDAILKILHLLTSVTLACFVLALLFDQQYPTDDGSCVVLSTKLTCLARTSVLDPSCSYCRWTELESAGVLEESRQGILFQSIPLETVLSEGAARCVFNDGRPSGRVTLAAVLITTVLMSPVTVLLQALFRIVQATPVSRRSTSKVDVEVTKMAQDVQSLSLSDLEQGSNTKADHELRGPTSTTNSTNTLSLAAADKIFERTSIFRADIRAPTVPPEAYVSRQWICDHLPMTFIQSMKTDAIAVNVLEQPTELTKSRDNLVSDILKQLSDATEAEAGMCLIQTMYRDMFMLQDAQFFSGQDVTDLDCPHNSLFANVLHRSFSSQSKIDSRIQNVTIVLLILINIGALYFVALKGATRGLEWQSNLLRICLVEWCVEVFFHQSVEVYLVEYLVPNTMYGKVHRMMQLVIFLSSRYVQSLEGAKYCDTDKKPHKWTVSNAIIQKNWKEYSARFWERRFVMFALSQWSLLRIKSDSNNFKSTMFLSGYATKWLLWLARQSDGTQRLMSYLISVSIFGIMFFVWIMLRPLGVVGIGVTIAVVVSIFLLTLAIFWRCHRSIGDISMLGELQYDSSPSLQSATIVLNKPSIGVERSLSIISSDSSSLQYSFDIDTGDSYSSEMGSEEVERLVYEEPIQGDYDEISYDEFSSMDSSSEVDGNSHDRSHYPSDFDSSTASVNEYENNSSSRINLVQCEPGVDWDSDLSTESRDGSYSPIELLWIPQQRGVLG
jgi:hypothetical protein